MQLLMHPDAAANAAADAPPDAAADAAANAAADAPPDAAADAP